MTRESIYQMLLSSGFPVAYEIFGEGQKKEPPYIIYSFPQSNPFFADGVIYCEIDKLQINLYTRIKDEKIEKEFEAVLIENGLDCFRRKETHDPQEDLFEITYELEVAIDYG